MSFFKNLRRMLKEPVPRWLFGYVWGSSILSIAIFVFAPIPWGHKQVIAVALMIPYAGVIPLLELFLLIRERRLMWFFKLLRNQIPLFFFLTFINCFAAPQYAWQLVEVNIAVMLMASLFGSWGRRMINLGYFGPTTES